MQLTNMGPRKLTHLEEKLDIGCEGCTDCNMYNVEASIFSCSIIIISLLNLSC